MDSRIAEMRQSVEAYRRLIEKNSEFCHHLRERRKNAVDGVMVEIDSMIAAKQRLIESLKRSVEATEAQIQAEERSHR